jgi:hypothetical protein
MSGERLFMHMECGFTELLIYDITLHPKIIIPYCNLCMYRDNITVAMYRVRTVLLCHTSTDSLSPPTQPLTRPILVLVTS